MAKRKKKKCVVLKADFEKAYDSVSWRYLDYMMGRMGFDEKWRRWMRGCYTSNSISVLVNGSPTEEFVAQKGLKQGDPLAPFLFLIVAEGLAGLVKKGVESSRLQGFKVSESLSVPLLQFADDTIFFSDGSESSILCLKSILRSFEMVSGLKVNFAKSNVVGFNMEARVVEGISQFLACNIGSVPFKFLGVPVGANPRRVSTWKPVVDAINARLSSWRSKQLSIGGRVTLINSVLSALPLYLFSFYKVPRRVIDEITKLQRRFLWGGSGESKKMAWINWNLICEPKNRGGLGIKNLEAFNVALLVKWRWRFLVEGDNVLWKNVLVERYGVKERWPEADVNSRGWGKKSLWWRDLCLLGEGTNLVEGWFNEVVKIKMGRGNMARFWTDCWLGRESFSAMFPILYSRCNARTATVAEMGCWADHRWRWKWDWIDENEAIVAENLRELKVLLADIKPAADIDDKWCWTLDSTCGFTVKRCYDWLLVFFAGDRAQIEERKAEACRKLWRNNVPSKILIFAWRILLNKIATRDALARRGLIQSQEGMLCALCSTELESVNHLLRSCVVAKEIWHQVYGWMGVSEAIEDDVVSHFMEFGKLVKGKERKGVKHLIWMAVVWNIWLARNNNVFNGEGVSISAIVSSIKSSAWGWFKARRGRNSGVGWSDWFNCPIGCLLSV